MGLTNRLGQPNMAREARSIKQARVERVLELLRKTYPEAHCELDYSNPLELLIATILSAQCSDKQVNRVTAELFQRFRTAKDYARAPLRDLESAIQSLGLYRNKAKNIQGCCRRLVDRHGGEVPRTMEELLELDGVGRKTANVVLGNAFQLNHGIVVDTHVARVARRLNLSRETVPEKIERDLQRWVPLPLWAVFSHWLIWHGRRRCFARKPDCPGCQLRDECPSSGEKQ